MGQVFRARDTKLDRDVAIKILPEAFAHDAERLARFMREAKTLASLNHSNIGAIYGLEESGGVTSLVMELVEGDDLSQRIARGPIPLVEALPIAKQIADALEAAHEQGIIHRDLKPANIKVRNDGTVKVLDFGLAKATEPPTGAPPSVSMSPTLSMHATQAGIILGTAAYMSPEQAAGKAVDKRSDLWSFGVVVLEMLTGQPVFTGETVSHVLASVLKSDPDWAALPTHTPAPIRRLLRRCLDKDRKRRLESAADARLELEEALTAPSATEGAAAPLAGMPRRLIIVAASAAVIVAAFASLTTWALTRPAPSKDTRPIWLQIRPPEGQAVWLARNAPQVAISPDGHQIVYAATVPDGGSRLWLHRLDALAPQLIAGTEGGTTPFWSPDGRSVGFFQTGQLKKVDIATVTTQVICDAPNGAGGTWNPFGDIVLSMGRPRRLHRVRATGGSPTPVTTLDSADRASDQVWPQFLPDGRHIVFATAAGFSGFVAQGGGTFVSDLAGGTPKQIVGPTDGLTLYAPPGHLLFAQGSTLLAQAFDAQRLETVGEAVAIASNVSSTPPAYSVSPAGVLAFLPPSAAQVTQLTWFNRSGHLLGTLGAHAAHEELSLSPDERQVATEISDPRTGQADIWLIDALRTISARLTSTHGPEEMPVWSTDGVRIAYASHRNGRIAIVLKSTRGGAESVLAIDAGHMFDWSPDGKYILYSTDENLPTETLWAKSTAGDATPVRVLQARGINDARFSPDGHWFAYSSNESGRREVYVTDFPAATTKAQISGSGGDEPVWSRRSNEIIYLAADNTLMSVPVKTGTSFDAGTPLPLFGIRINRVNRRHQYDVSADGQRFLVAALVGDTGVQSAITVVLNWPALLKK